MVGVLAEPGSRLRCTHQRRSRAVGRSRLREPIARIGDERASFDELVERGDVGAVSDRRVRDAEGGGQVKNVVDAVLAHPLVDLFGVDVGLFGDGKFRLLVDPLFVADHGAQVEPLLCGATSQRHQAVGRRCHAGDGEATTVAKRSAQCVIERHRIVSETESLRFEHRDVHEAGLHCHRARSGKRARQPLPDLPGDEQRRAILRTPTETDHAARPRLQGELGCRLVRPRPLEAERSYRRDGQVGMGFGQCCGRKLIEPDDR